MNKQRKAIIASNEISLVKTYELGGINQKVLIEGKTKDLPIVLTLHGGPGSPFPFSVGGRGLFPDFTEKCILVSWDQYGCGINNAVLPDTFTINHFVEMTKDLIYSLKKEFTKNKIYLFGMSWGSVLAAKTAVEIPDVIDGVMIYGQVLQNLMRTEDVIEALLLSNAPAKLKATMKTIFEKDSIGQEELMALSKWIRKYTQGYQNKTESKMNISNIFINFLQSPDYTFKDFLALVINGYMKNHSLMNELSAIDLSDTLKAISVPYYIMQGETDIVTSTKEIASFISTSHNKYLLLNVIANTSHIPGANGMNTIIKTINNLNEQSYFLNSTFV